MNEAEELAHLTAPSSDPKQRMIDYWGHRAEKAEDEVERLRAIITRAKDALLDGQSTQWVHDVLVQGLHRPQTHSSAK